MTFRSILYAVTCISFCMVIGAATYEHAAVVPQWAAAPPASLSMFQGKYGLNPTPFWKLVHPVTVLLLIITLALFWSTGSRLHIAATLAGYVIVLIITFTFFVPQLVAITGSAFSEKIDAGLVKRARQWEILSQARLLVLVLLAMVLITGINKSTLNWSKRF